MYYIFENQIRPDGTVNNLVEARTTFATGLSHTLLRHSKMVVSKEFVSVHILFCDEQLHVIKQIDVETQYQAPEAEQAEAEA